jgi:hypothetical protein
MGMLADYYLEPLVQVVHVALSIDYFNCNPEALSHDLGIEGRQLHGIIETLSRLGFLIKEGDRFIVKEPSLHLTKGSLLCKVWRNQLKQIAAQRMNKLVDSDFYSFATVFSADSRTQGVIQEKFIDFLKSCEQLVDAAPAARTYQLSFDLFPWTR